MSVQQTLNSAHLNRVDLDQQGPKSGRFHAIDHLRGVACLMIVFCHATIPLCEERRIQHEMLSAQPVAVRLLESSKSNDQRPPFEQITTGLIWLTTQMRFGVEMFFVISGFCVASSAISILQSGRTFREYFKRRFLRIYPTFWAAVIISIFAALAIELISPGVLDSGLPLTNPSKMSVLQWFGCLTLTETWLHYFTGEERLCFPNQSWSLCHEEQFYAVVGIMMMISGRRFFRVAAMITAGIAGVNLLARVYGFHLRGFFFDEQWFIFAAGMGVYWSVNFATPRMSTLFHTFLIGAIIGLISLALIKPNFGNGPAFPYSRVAGALVFAVVLLGLYRYDAKIVGMKWLNWLKSCGLMSYSIYLAHVYPVKMLSRQMLLAGFNDDLSTLFICIPLSLAMAISLGYILHISVER